MNIHEGKGKTSMSKVRLEEIKYLNFAIGFLQPCN